MASVQLTTQNFNRKKIIHICTYIYLLKKNRKHYSQVYTRWLLPILQCFAFYLEMHLGIEMLNAMSAGFCSQFIESVRGTSTWQVQDREIDGAQKSKTKQIWRSILLPKKKPKKQFGTGIIFLHSSFSHPHLHHPVTEWKKHCYWEGGRNLGLMLENLIWFSVKI